MARAWAVITAQVFSMTIRFVPRVFPGGFHEGFMKFFGCPNRGAVAGPWLGGPFLGKPSQECGHDLHPPGGL
jgi:hypothetical protein